MKRIIHATLTALLLICLSACSTTKSAGSTPPTSESPVSESPPQTSKSPALGSEADPNEKIFTFTRDNMPRLDGSTSTVPLAEAVCSVLLGENRAEVADLVQFDQTTEAYYNLINGYADLLIVGEYNEYVVEEKEKLGFEWERAPFAADAFIFVVNEDNPVNSITIDEAKRIYTGEITNWNELGGNDQQIIPLQRNSNAGSQNLMEKLVMKGTPMMDAPIAYVVNTMGQLMEVAKGYDGSAGAIGYTVYYYAEEMKMAQGLKILAIEGIEPNPATIRSEEYPLLNPKYVVIPADAAEDSPNRILYNWLLSEDGQRLVAHEGYVSVIEVNEP